MENCGKVTVTYRRSLATMRGVSAKRNSDCIFSIVFAFFRWNVVCRKVDRIIKVSFVVRDCLVRFPLLWNLWKCRDLRD